MTIYNSKIDLVGSLLMPSEAMNLKDGSCYYLLCPLFLTYTSFTLLSYSTRNTVLVITYYKQTFAFIVWLQ